MPKKKNFIDFIVDTQQDKTLGMAFLKLGTAKEMEQFFHDRGYEGLSAADIAKLLAAKERMIDNKHIDIVSY